MRRPANRSGAGARRGYCPIPVGERLYAGRQRIPRDAQIPDGEVGEYLRETQQAIFGRDLPERRPVDRVSFCGR